MTVYWNNYRNYYRTTFKGSLSTEGKRLDLTFEQWASAMLPDIPIKKLEDLKLGVVDEDNS